MTARTQTREHLLYAAAALLRRQGYAATGLNQVLAEGSAQGRAVLPLPGGEEQLAAEAVG